MTREGWDELMNSYGKDKFYFETSPELVCEETMRITSENFHTFTEDGKSDGAITNPTECGTNANYIFVFAYASSVTFVIFNLFIAVVFDWLSRRPVRSTTREEAPGLWQDSQRVGYTVECSQ